MSGHSRWSTIKRKKGAADAKRGKIFTKLIREITHRGPDRRRRSRREPAAAPRASTRRAARTWPRTRSSARSRRASAETRATAFEEVVYEGYGPGGTAIYVETLTDNRNRTVGEVRHVLTKHGGNLGATGCVAYLFEKRGVATFDARVGRSRRADGGRARSRRQRRRGGGRARSRW